MKQKQQKIIILCKYWLIANYKRELWLKTFKIRVIQICAIICTKVMKTIV